MKTGGDAQEQIGNHCGEDLQLNGVVVVAKKLADIEMLLDPAEQQLGLPSALVEGGDVDPAVALPWCGIAGSAVASRLR